MFQPCFEAKIRKQCRCAWRDIKLLPNASKYSCFHAIFAIFSRFLCRVYELRWGWGSRVMLILDKMSGALNHHISLWYAAAVLNTCWLSAWWFLPAVECFLTCPLQGAAQISQSWLQVNTFKAWVLKKHKINLLQLLKLFAVHQQSITCRLSIW